jgi:nucleoside 2-deoxyribosyltransferase
MKRVYLAGPDVFYKNAVAHAKEMKRVCSSVGLEGVFPLDVEVHSADLIGYQIAQKIFISNIGLIESCQGVLANMTSFRGPSADVGTAWEMGFAYGLKLPVVGYTNDFQVPYEKRVIPDEYDIESFGLVDSLMLVFGSFGPIATSLVEAAFNCSGS